MSVRREWLLSRRQVLGGISAAGVCSLLPSPRARAQSAIPKRLIVVHVPEGMWPGAPRPSGSSLGPILEPLEPFSNYVNVLNGMDLKLFGRGPGRDNHFRIPQLLTGVLLRDADSAGGGSVDQHIARHIAGDTPFQSIQLGVRIISRTAVSGFIWGDPNNRLQPEQSPWAAYDRYFRNLPSNPTSPIPAFDFRTSVLDHSLREVEALRTRLSATDRERLDSYRSSLRELETRLTSPTPGATACEAPEVGNERNLRSDANYPIIGQLQMDILVHAMQCDLTRVASLQWGTSVDRCSYPWLGVNRWGHEAAHDRSASGQKQRIYRWYSEQFAYLLGALQQVQESDGSTMLDHTVVLWASEFGNAGAHSGNNLMWVLMGNVDGYFTPGRVHDVSGRSTNDLLTTLCQAYGMSDSSYGDRAQNNGPIDSLRA